MLSLDFETSDTQPKTVKRRKINDIDVEKFQEDISNSTLMSPSGSLEEMVCDYQTTLSALLDKHAPVTEKILKPRIRQPWYSHNLRALRKKSRRKERHFRKIPKQNYRHEAAKVDFKNAEANYFKSVDNAKTSYFSNLVIDNKKDQGKLYWVPNNIMNKKKENPLPDHSSMIDLAETFGKFFVDKIDRIRETFNDNGDLFEFDLPTHIIYSFSNFRELDYKEVKQIIDDSSSKSSILDPMPTMLRNSQMS